MVKRLFTPLTLIAIAVALSACGKADEKATSSQIAAKVNRNEISVHQVNHAIAHDRDIAPEKAKQAAGEALERVIDQELLVQKALEAKQDRDPQVMQAIENAKRQILAQAYIDKVAIAASTDSQESIAKFYKANPALFERRRIYRVHEVAVAAPQEKLHGLKAEAAKAKDLNSVMAWLKSQQLPYTLTTSSRPAEQVPLAILPQMYEMKDGQIAVLTSSNSATVMQLMGAEEAPMNEQQATPIIKQFLAGRKRLEVAQDQIRKLRQQAKIEYVGEFASAHTVSLPKATPSSAAPSGIAEDDGGYIKRGLAGLK
jgi:EpsD family peptidyl-prolyl cis-trans isomerase